MTLSMRSKSRTCQARAGRTNGPVCGAVQFQAMAINAIGAPKEQPGVCLLWEPGDRGRSSQATPGRSAIDVGPGQL